MENKRCIILGAGFSVNIGIEKGLWEVIKSQNIWSLNYGYMTMPYLPKREVWVDYSFFKNNIESLQQLSQQGVEIVCKAHPNYKMIPKIITYDTTREKLHYWGKLSKEKKSIFSGSSGLVGIFGLTLAIAEGYTEIFLLGFDWGLPLSNLNTLKTHYYQDKLNVISSGIGKPEVYLTPEGKIKTEVEDFSVFLQEKDVKIWNVSPESNIPYFSKISYGAFFEYITAKKMEAY